jgi:rRNA-processing protein FCF1
MKPTKIEFQFDNAKLEAINLFLKDKDSKLSDELDRFMDELYKTYVPQQVREFIEKKEAEAQQNASAFRPSSRRKPESRSSEDNPA